MQILCSCGKLPRMRGMYWDAWCHDCWLAYCALTPRERHAIRFREDLPPVVYPVKEKPPRKSKEYALARQRLRNRYLSDTQLQAIPWEEYLTRNAEEEIARGRIHPFKTRRPKILPPRITNRQEWAAWSRKQKRG